MGICVHCMQQKPITADKCHHCHERTGLLASLGWTVLHSALQIIFMIVIFSLLYQCVSSVGAAPQTEQVSK